MSVLPSPIPHPLDYSPWDLPGWAYEALDWVVGVEWPDGDERAVWDLADQWYAVAGALTGPRDDAITAAAQVRSGYGGIGAVSEAFDTAWRRLSDGDDAPLPVLLAVSTDLGRLVEECGCDIEAAKLEVWIELGILVVELLALAVAAALTAGAASPAAGAAVTASRLVIQQIFRRLLAQMARKALRQGLKEAGERAAKEVAKGGMRGLGRRALRGGMFEAGEEAGVSLATQAYQNSTGRRHGLDLADLGTSALGGLAGGAVAPLAGLGRHATGRGARVGEHLGREMTGEVLAEGAAGLATGQGMVSLEDATRAAVSGVSGSATSQADAALHARLDGRLHSLADASQVAADFPAPPSSPLVAGGVPVPAPDVVPGHVGPSLPAPDGLAPVVDSAGAVDAAREARTPHGSGVGAGPASSSTVAGGQTNSVVPVSPDLGAPSLLSTVVDPAIPAKADPAPATATPTLSAVSLDHSSSPAAEAPTALVRSSTPTHGVATMGISDGGATAGGSPSFSIAAPPSVAGPSSGHATPTTAGHAATTPPQRVLPGTVNGTLPYDGAGAASRDTGGSLSPPYANRFPLLDALAPGPATPTVDHSLPLASPEPRDEDDPPRPRPSVWPTAEREALDRSRYQGHLQAQRVWYEDQRRRDLAAHLRESANDFMDRARWFREQARQAARSGFTVRAEHLSRASAVAERDAHELNDQAEAALTGVIAPAEVVVDDAVDFYRINNDVADLALGAIETADRSALTGDDNPPPIDRSRRYGQFGGLRPPLALHQTDLERQMPRNPDGSVVRTADPRAGGWFALANDGGPQADPTRGINCLDCTLSLYETWLHGRPRVSAPRTFDGYLEGDIQRPINGEAGGPGRVEEVTGGRFQKLFVVKEGETPGPVLLHQSVERGYRNLHDQLILGRHGSYAFLITEWEDGGSHIWVALNQNGAVLYLDPQNGTVHDRPLYAHSGRPHPENVVSIDVLVLGGDGRPMPLGGLARGRFSVHPDLPHHPSAPDDQHGYGDPYVNRMYLLDGPGRPGPSPDAYGNAPAPSGPPEMPSEPTAELAADERSALDRLHERARTAADRVESALNRVAERVTVTLGASGAVELRDQEFRLKSPESLARKFLDEAVALGVSVEEFSSEVNDVLRFCLVVPEGEPYERAVRGVLEELRRAGFTVGDRSCKNFWRVGNRFYGFNCTVSSPEGQLFELQLHSQSSRAAWLETHHAYEVLRRTVQSPARRVHAFLEMLAINRRSGIPDEVPTRLSVVFPAKDASFAKWVHLNASIWRSYTELLRAEGRDFADVALRFGLTAQDFPISPELEQQLERLSVDLLRSVPHL
ncbi:toxin glutamine deamidase domain-containing protein [Micromonospora sp. NPDC092111]|uniref:toxin glutamine deamidase domain-containing protein n=1 Tax=Micromonospora sp. NPDC092111 TaxID=3364289 RepID=UPI003809A808